MRERVPDNALKRIRWSCVLWCLVFLLNCVGATQYHRVFLIWLEFVFLLYQRIFLLRVFKKQKTRVKNGARKMRNGSSSTQSSVRKNAKTHQIRVACCCCWTSGARKNKVCRFVWCRVHGRRGVKCHWKLLSLCTHELLDTTIHHTLCVRIYIYTHTRVDHKLGFGPTRWPERRNKKEKAYCPVTCQEYKELLLLFFGLISYYALLGVVGWWGL